MTSNTVIAIRIISNEMFEKGVDFRTDIHGIEAMCLADAANELEHYHNSYNYLLTQLGNYKKLEEELGYHKTAINQLLACFEYIAGDCEDDDQAERELYAIDYAKDTLTGNENK